MGAYRLVQAVMLCIMIVVWSYETRLYLAAKAPYLLIYAMISHHKSYVP